MDSKPTKKVVFLGSKEIGYACLEHLLLNCHQLEIEVIAALTNDRSIGNTEKSIRSLCTEHSVPILEGLDQLKLLNSIDVLLSVQYHLILKAEHIHLANQIAVNLHMAPLPEYRGCNQFSFAIIDQKKTFGTTLHVMEPGIDNGDILFEKRFPMDENITVSQLYQKTHQASTELFKENILALLNGNYIRTSQDSLIESRGTAFHTRKEINDIKIIDLNWPKEKIDRYIRATYFPPFSPPYAIKDNSKIELTTNWQEEIK